MRLGYIDYLNCFPYYYHLLHEPPPGISIVSGYPEELNRMMARGELDMSPVSAAVYAELRDRVVLLPDFCLSSIGYVRSVVLRSACPIEMLDGKTIGLSSASKTSVVLLKILLEKYFGVRPRYTTVGPLPDWNGIDAALIIGNEAMADPSGPVGHLYDLGELWLAKTGFPVVFAVFLVRTDVRERYRTTIDEIRRSFRDSLTAMEADRGRFLAAAQERYPRVNTDVDSYYRLLRYEFTPALAEALLFYFREASALGLLPAVERLQEYR